VHLAQLIIPFPEGMPEPERQKAIKRAAAMAPRIGSCDAMRREAAKYGEDMGGDLGWLDTKDLPPILQQIVTEIPNGRLSPPLAGSAGIQMIMVCERVGGAPARPAEPARPQQAAPPPPPPPSMDREAVQQRLELEQLDGLAARYLRDLRRDAFIDLRGA
jgi:peptidyl-prolyl cis-trans isomerase SurA